jgi:hypothetical protein
MAAPGLSTSSAGRLPVGLPGAWLHVYTAIWMATLGFAGIVALAGQPLTQAAHHLLGLQLTPARNPPPTVEHVLVLAAHNIPIFAWPLLLGVTGAHRHRIGVRVADTLVLASAFVNTGQVGVALGGYGAALLPYVPNVPFEWAGLALGVSYWIVQRRRAISVHDGIVWFALTVGVLLCAATLETVAVPHR